MQLSCNVCGAPISTDGLDLQRQIARCLHCNAVYSLAGPQAQGPSAREYEIRPAARVPMPKKFQVEEEPGLLRISWRWFSPTLIFLAFFCVFWDGFLLVWYGVAFAMKDPPLMMVLFPLLHVAVGVGLTYRVIAGFLNKTVVEVSRRTVSIKHGPLPWKGNQTLEAVALKQLFCERKISHGKNSSTTTYQLNAVARDGRKVELLDGLEEPGQVLYLEEQLEKRLGIRDEQVVGELDKGRMYA